MAARRRGRRRARQDPRPRRRASHRRRRGDDATTTTSGRRTPRWWQDGFTEGADPEYEEQILPLAAEHLAGARPVLDVGCGEGQVARLAAGRGRRAASSASTRPWAQVAVAAERGRRAGLRPGRARRRCRSPTASFDAVVACLVFEHIRDVDDAIAEVARVLAPGGRFLFFLNHPLLQTPNSGWIDDQVLDPPEQYWRIGPYLVEDETIEEVEKGVFIPFIHRPLSRYVNALAGNGLLLEQHGGAGPAARLPRPGRGVRRRPPPSRGCCSCRCRKQDASQAP